MKTESDLHTQGYLKRLKRFTLGELKAIYLACPGSVSEKIWESLDDEEAEFIDPIRLSSEFDYAGEA